MSRAGFSLTHAIVATTRQSKTEDSAGVFGTMRDRAGEIVDSIDLDSKTDRFPEAYLDDYGGELDYITYE